LTIYSGQRIEDCISFHKSPCFRKFLRRVIESINAISHAPVI